MYFPAIEAVEEGGYGGDPTGAWIETGGPERMMDRALMGIYRLMGRLK
ncbi:MAG: hypothetical protein HYR60_02280 [Acidobacteria bacterium]|nr:hypothetical protein [Acidobacteriota bacterium]